MSGLALGGSKFLWDMLVGLVRGYESGKKDLFTSHIEPLHDRMMEIHKDYISGFEEVRSLLESKSAPTNDILQFLKDRRRDYLADRVLAQKLSEELLNAERRVVRNQAWESVSSYCTAIQKYFIATSGVGGISWYSSLLDSIEEKLRMGNIDSLIWTPMQIGGNPREILLQEVNAILDIGLPKALSPISTYYARLRRDLM